MVAIYAIERTGTAASGSESPSPEDSATYLVNYFYESLNSQDYVTAYSLLGSSWQSKLDSSKFRNGYLYTKSVTLDDVKATKNGDNITVMATLSAVELNDRTESYANYQLEYNVGYENDQLKILNGNAKKIQ